MVQEKIRDPFIYSAQSVKFSKEIDLCFVRGPYRFGDSRTGRQTVVERVDRKTQEKGRRYLLLGKVLIYSNIVKRRVLGDLLKVM